MTSIARAAPTAIPVLGQVERRVLWLSTAIVHHANRVRPNPLALKVGGHQASSASMVSIMTRAVVSPPAAQRPGVGQAARLAGAARDQLPARRAATESYLTRLREFGGLQSYPSRAKDPDPVDYSTGSVGIGATAPIWGALARRYVRRTFGGRGTGRQYSLLGDAELDEGAVLGGDPRPAVADLGEIVWIVDLNRQSLDRVVPIIARRPAAGDVRRGRLAGAHRQVRHAAARAVRRARRRRAARRASTTMPNPEYQRLLRCDAAQLRERLPGDSAEVADLLAEQSTTTALLAVIRNLGGHDLGALRAAFDADRRHAGRRCIFAYTIKG
mgnify:CR=1 FL=1